MRLTSARIGAVLIAASTLFMAFALPSGNATTRLNQTVALRATLSGRGTLSLTGNPSFICRAKTCTHTFHVRRGRQMVATAKPSQGWKLRTWAGACTGSTTMCTLRLNARQSVVVKFVPPGDRTNPYRLGTAMPLYGGWKLSVNSASLDADAQVEAVIDPSTGLPANAPPPAGDQYALVNVSMTYVGGGYGRAGDYVFSWLGAEGAHRTLYQPLCTPPPLDLSLAFQPLAPGQSETGNLCFEIASNDTTSLLLGGYGAAGSNRVWFALHD
jgi:hypothetical protein